MERRILALGSSFLSLCCFSLVLVLGGCLGSGDDVDEFFGTSPGTIPVAVPPSSDLSISITNPGIDNTAAGYEILLSGSCGTIGKVVEVTGGVTTALAVCNTGNMWTVSVDLSGVPIGSITLSARLKDDALNEYGTPATRVVNKLSSVCDTLAARTDTFANFSTGGDGGAVPWIICTTTQLQNLNSFLTDNAELGTDIDFAGGTFAGIGGTYSGTFDGNNLQIKNFLLSSTGSSRGLFLQVNNTTTIQNLIVDNATITLTGTAYRAAVVVGYALQNTTLTLNNVHVRNSSVTTGHATNGEAGALLGRTRDLASTTTITNSSVTNTNIISQNNTGGMIGYIEGAATAVTITDSFVSGGSVSGRSNVGGFIGVLTQDGAIVSRSYSTANVTGSNGDIGGFAGEIRGTLTDIYATGTVNRTGGNQVGGLIGYLVGGTTTLSGSQPAATRVNPAVAPLTCFASGTVNGGAAQYVGGLVGRNDVDTVQSCYATGDVNGGVNYVGGLIGRNTGDLVDDCFATGSVSGTENYIGGLIGHTTNAGETITSSYATGNVSSTGLSPEYVGGFVGRFSGTDRVQDSYATGDVSAINGDGSGNIQYIGGFIGYAEETGRNTISCYATGDVTVSSSVLPANSRYIGGLHGRSNHIVATSYATGNVTYADGQHVGGLIGYQSVQSITDSYATGNVIGGRNYVGGLVGFANTNTDISGCFALGDVDGDISRYVGGFAGYMRSDADSIVDNFAVNTVRGGQDVGGFVGRFRRQSSDNGLRRVYHVGDVIRATGGPGADSTFGPVVGVIQSGNGAVENGTNFYNSDFDVVDEATSLSIPPNLTNQTPLTSIQMQASGNFTSYDFGTPVWEMPPGGYVLPNTVGYQFPILDWMN